MTTAKEPPAIDRLAAIAIEARDNPSPDTDRRLADAALLHGLIYSERDTAALWLIARVQSMSTDAMREMQSVLDGEYRRRERGDNPIGLISAIERKRPARYR